jgi:hypothetical protein
MNDIEKQVRAGTDCLRQEFTIGSKRWDIGFGDAFVKFPAAAKAQIAGRILETACDGISVLDFGNLEPQFILKQSDKSRLDILVRDDAVRMWGEEAVLRLEEEKEKREQP